MNKIIKFSFITIASCLLLGAQVGVQSVIMAGVSGSPPLNPCLVSAWPMNEGSGLTLHDTSTGGTNTATITNAGTVTWQANSGYPGTTPKWNNVGLGALASSATLTNFTGTTPFSATVWATQGIGGGNTLMSTLSTSTFQGWELFIDPSGGGFSSALVFTVSNNFSSNALQVASTNPVPSTGANYLAVTYDGTQVPSGVKIYLNGSLETNHVAFNTLSGSAANGLPVRFGIRNDGTFADTAPMAFAEVYNCVLTSGQISTYFAAGPGIY